MRHLHLVGIHWSSQFTLLKFLLAKVVWEGYQTLTDLEEFLLVETYASLDLNTNFDFVKYKRGKLIKLSTIINYYNHCKAQNLNGAQHIFTNKAKLLLAQGVLPSSHAYFGWAKLFNVNRFVRSISPRERSRKRAKRFIGVGYKDKGTMKNPATDSTPAWQDVAAVDLKLPPPASETDRAYKLYWTNWGYRKDPFE